jgi:hypothetical protein
MELPLGYTRYYHHAGYYYRVREGQPIIQFAADYFLPFMPGDSVYGKYYRELNKMEPITNEEARQAIRVLRQSLDYMIKEISGVRASAT